MEQRGFKVWSKPREIACCSSFLEGWEERGATLGVGGMWAVKMQRKEPNGLSQKLAHSK